MIFNICETVVGQGRDSKGIYKFNIKILLVNKYLLILRPQKGCRGWYLITPAVIFNLKINKKYLHEFFCCFFFLIYTKNMTPVVDLILNWTKIGL